MKIIKNFSIFLISLITVFQFYAMEKSSWSNRMYKKASNVATQAKQKLYSSRLAAGYHSTPQEKEAAYENIRELLFEKDQLQDLINNSDANSADKQSARNKIKQIDREIHTQKIITGEKWSTMRKLAWGGLTLGAGVAGATTLYSYYKPSNLTPTPIKPEVKIDEPEAPKIYTPTTMPLLIPGQPAKQTYIIDFSTVLANAPEKSTFKSLPQTGKKHYDWNNANYRVLANQTNPNNLVLNEKDTISNKYILYGYPSSGKNDPKIILLYFPETGNVDLR